MKSIQKRNPIYPLMILVLMSLIAGKAYSKDWILVWSDEFDDASLDTSVWSVEVNDFGGFNNELQYYTDREENIKLENGCLVITGRTENYLTRQYTSARIHSRGKKSFMYGKFEAKMKLPYGNGMWPAFWIMGNNGGWPACGEVDIMEMVGGDGCGPECGDNLSWGCMWYLDSNGEQLGKSEKAPVVPGIKYADEFHVFGIEWDETEIRWYVDGMEFHSVKITDPEFSEFHQPFYFLLNLAIGGDWPGSPDKSTVFPQKMYVDYLRIYKQPTIPRGTE